MKHDIEWKSIKTQEPFEFGTFGEVKKGYSSVFGQVVLKQLNFEDDDHDMGLWDQFITEVNAVSCKASPFILRFYGTTISNEGELYMVTEYASKGSLYNYISNLRDSKEFPWSMRYRISMEIAQGLAFIHHKGVVHCNLKSSNVLLDQSFTAKLFDFGLTRFKDPSLSKSNDFFNSLKWRAPESIGSSMSFQSDIYSLGMVFWELASLKTPFLNSTPRNMWADIVGGEIIPEDTPFRYKELITACWNPDPDQRPTIMSIIQALEALTNNNDTKTDCIDPDDLKVDSSLLSSLKKENLNLKTMLSHSTKCSQMISYLLKGEEIQIDIFKAAEEGSTKSIIYHLSNGKDINTTDVFDICYIWFLLLIQRDSTL